MASEYSSNRYGKRVKVEETKEEIPVPEEVSHNTVRLVLLRNTNMKVQGSVTGHIYMFNGAGYELEVDERDAPKMLDMRRNSCNCSGMPGQPYFEIITGG